jgi:hypothetical protein
MGYPCKSVNYYAYALHTHTHTHTHTEANTHRVHKSRANTFGTMVPNFLRSSLWSQHDAILLASRILKWLLDFWKICVYIHTHAHAHTHTHGATVQ